MKKSLALMLALIMVLCMLPTTALAADIIDLNNNVYIYKGEPINYKFLRKFDGGSITKQENEEVTWQRLPRYTNICNCGRVLEEVIPDLYCINPDKNIEITNPEVIGKYGVRVASWKGNDVYNGYPCFEFYCKAAKAGETDVKVTYYYNYNYRGASGYCNYCGRRVTVPAQTIWYEESVTFHVTCETQEPPTDNPPTAPKPENTSEPVFSELIGDKVVKVECTITEANHNEKIYGLKHDSYTVGAVSGNKENGYTCEITVKPDKYVEAYNTDISVEHKLDPESQTGTITLNWNAATKQWEYTENKLPVTFTVKCDNTQPPLDNITIEVSKVWHDDSGDVAKPEKITVNLLKNGTVVENAPIMPDNEGTWFHRFDNMPANDSNNKPINYTVKEENVPAGWTPYYWTADKLIFQIHNVPTKNTREIKVTKKVSGEGADKAKYFDFKVTLFQDLDGNGEIGVGISPLSGTYTFGGVTFTKGVATFKLKDGESFTITGIPSHVQYLPLQYKVEEIAPSGYTVKVNGSAGSSINGDFTDAKTVNITFENVKESGTNPTPTPTPTPTSTPGGGNGGGGHWHPTTTPVPVIVIPPKTGDMTIWQSILHFLGIR